MASLSQKTGRKVCPGRPGAREAYVWETVYFSLGSNLGNRHTNLENAIRQLEPRIGEILIVSTIFETEPVGKTDQPWFLNCCVEMQTELPPQKLLAACQKIENALGRVRREKWGPRTIDIDILFYGEQICRTKKLTIPHPEISKRRFVLVPLAEIAPDFRHPLLEKNIRELLKECPDTSIVKALHGNPSAQKTRHAVPDRHSLGRS